MVVYGTIVTKSPRIKIKNVQKSKYIIVNITMNVIHICCVKPMYEIPKKRKSTEKSTFACGCLCVCMCEKYLWDENDFDYGYYYDCRQKISAKIIEVVFQPLTCISNVFS